ncbi:MAG: InlB B-repeat-containing protein [Salinivirgaceae bacterium]|nr:InlB B-repeat-containing protein [Salinivirgaceae bacterium]
MKNILSKAFMAVCLTAMTFAAIAQNSFNYQAVIRDGGKVLENKAASLRLSVISDDSVYYQEKHAVTTNAYGNVNVSVGEGETLRGNFNAIPWETMQVMMQVEVSTDGSDNYTNMGSMQIMPVPYALYAAHTSVIQPTVATEDPIFEVRDSEGNLMFAVYETGVKVFVDQEGSKAAKSKFAVAGLSEEKGEQSLLTINADGTTVYVDDNSKAAKSKFAVAGQSADKTNYNLLTIDGSGSTVYVGGEGKAAKSKFAVAGYSANKAAENNYSIDGDGSTVYVDFTDNSKGSADVLSIDGSQATFYVDDTKEGKAAKSSFAVAGRSAGKSVDTAFIIDGSGTLIYIDDIVGSDKGDVSRFIVAGLTANNSGNYNDKFFTINRDSTRIYINDEPVVADTTGTGTTPVVTPSFASAFAIVGMTQKTELLTVNKDSTTIKVDTYVAEEVQSTTGVVEKVVDDIKPDKVYSTGTILALLFYDGSSDSIGTATTYAYYHSENGEYLYLKFNVGGYTEYHNCWFCNGKIHEQVCSNNGYGGYGGYGGYYSYYQQSYVGEFLEPRDWDGKSILLLMERALRDSGYAVMPNNGANYFYLKDESEKYIVSSENNIVTGLRGENGCKILHENLGTFACILDSILHLDYYVLGDIDWGNLDGTQKYGYALFGDEVITDNIIAMESKFANTEFENEAEAYRYRYDLYRYGLSDFENMFASFDKGFKVQVESDANGKVEVSNIQESYTLGQTVEFEAIPDDDYMFVSWSDGSTQNPRTITVMSDTTLKASFDRAAFYVKEGGDDNAAGTIDAPLATINGAVHRITENAKNIDGSYYKTFIIKVDGTLYGAQNIGAEFDAAFPNYEISELVLEGAHKSVAGQEPTDVLDGQFDETDRGSTLYINSKAPITIRNMKITGGCDVSGGGLYLWGNITDVTLDDGTLITGNRAINVVSGEDIVYGQGGGVYSCGAWRLAIKQGAVITGNTATYGGGFADNPASIIIDGGSVVGNTATSGLGNDISSYYGVSIGGDANVGDIYLKKDGSNNRGITIISNLTNSDLSVSVSADDLFDIYFNEGTEIVTLKDGVTMSADEVLSKFSFQGLWKLNPDDRKLRCLVEFEGDGADIGPMPPVQEFAKGEHATVEEPVIEPERDGYKFLGWYTSADGGETLSEAPFDFDTEFNFGGEENGSIIKGFKLYAKWLKAITYYVKPDGGDNSNNGLSEQDAFATFDYALQQIDQLNKPDSVFRIMIVGTIGALELSSALNDKANTIILQGYDEYAVIDGGFTKSNQGSALTIGTTVPVTINKLKITGGYAASGGGVYIHTGNASLNAYVTIGSGTLITENTAEGHDGQAGGGGIFSSDGTLRVFGGEISNNTNTNGTGGGILVYNGNVNIMGGKITENQAASGGGVYVFQYGNVTIGGNAKILSNSANEGGGIYFGSVSYNVIVGGNAEISGNSATGNGNGIYAGYSKLLLKDNVTIAADNDVYLPIPYGYDNIATIAVDGTLSDDNVITITPKQYNIGEPVLALVNGATTTIAAEYFKFTLSDSSYALGYDGKVRDGVAVDGKVYAKYPITTAVEYTELFDVMNNSKFNAAGMFISIESEADTLTLENFKPYDPGSIAFKGVFDGNGHTFNIKSVNSDAFCLVCWKNEGIIQNVKVVSEDTVEASNNGGVAYTRFPGSICYVNGEKGIIRNCWNAVSANVTFYGSVGAFCEYNDGLIVNCINTGSLTGTWGIDRSWKGTYAVLGGISANNSGTIVNCVNYGTISMATTFRSSTGLNGAPAAITASSCGTIQNCYWRQNCVVNNYGPNNMIYDDSDVYVPSQLRTGTATGCGFFPSDTVGTLTAGTVTTCGSEQKLADGTALLNALKAYVQASNAISTLNGRGAELKSWKVEDGSHAAVLDFGN